MSERAMAVASAFLMEEDGMSGDEIDAILVGGGLSEQYIGQWLTKMVEIAQDQNQILNIIVEPS